MIHVADWVLPMSDEPIRHGWVRVDRVGRVVEVGRGALPPDNRVVSHFGKAILPGLVNAHTHLNLSHFEQPVGHPGTRLADWIGPVVGGHLQTPIQRRRAAMRRAWHSMGRMGVAAVADIAQPDLPLEVGDGPVRYLGFAEVLGIAPERFDDRLTAALSIAVGHLSPHATYSLARGSVDRVVEEAARMGDAAGNRPAGGGMVAMHLAESPDERTLCFGGGGPLADTLRRMGVWRDGVFPWPTAERDWGGVIERLARARRGLIVHGNDLSGGELGCIARHPSLSVVYCPRTHDYFGYDPHPIAEAWRRGIRVAIGTDSLASNPDLSIWNEVRFLIRRRGDLDPAAVLRSATIDGADALGLDEFGRIEPGAAGGLVLVDALEDSIDAFYGTLADKPTPRFVVEPVRAGPPRSG